MKYHYFVLLILVLVAPLMSTELFAREVLRADDLEYVGAFKVQREVGDDLAETAYGSGLALRRVDGQVRLFSTAYKNGSYALYEITVPTLKSAQPWNTAPLTKNWGYVFTHKTGLLNGLYWDETDERLYYSSSPNYVASGDPYYPTLAFLTFNQDETQATSYGRWGFNNRSFKQVNFGVTPVPADFSGEYLGGKRLAAGFGGYQSIAGFGPASFGPALTAFSPPVVGTEGGYLTNTPLVGYGGSHDAWTTGDRPSVNRAWRDDDVIHDIYGNMSDPDNSTQNTAPYWHLSGDESFYWQGYSINGSSRTSIPDNVTFDNSRIVTKHWESGNAFWNTDYIFQSGAWIQTANKEGILFLATFDTGHVWYYNSNSNAEGMKHKWLIYSRDQIASIVQGSVGEDDIQPTRYDTNLTDLGIESKAHAGIPKYSCTGMAFDPVDNKLYVVLQYASNAPTINMYSTNLVAVYQVNDTIGSSANLNSTGQIPLSGSGTMTLQ